MHPIFTEIESWLSHISTDVFFWVLLIFFILGDLVFRRKTLLNVFSDSHSAYNMTLFIVIGILFASVSGHVGSTENMHPILEAIILSVTAVLTFLAFWKQYKFNTIQQSDIVRDRFENKFYRNLEMLMKLEDGCVIPHVGNGKQAFHFMFYEYKAIMSQILISSKVDWMNDGLDKFCNSVSLENLKMSQVDKEEWDIFWQKVNQISFNIFLSGVSTSAKTRLYKDCGVNKVQIDALNNYLIQRQYVSSSPVYLDDYDCKNVRLYDGHRLRLVSFFRNTCMLVQYVIKVADPKEPLEQNYYLLYFLSSLSEHEISLLYIIYRYSTDEHHLFIDLNKAEIDVFFSEILPKFIMATNLHPNDKEFYEFLNLERVNRERLAPLS